MEDARDIVQRWYKHDKQWAERVRNIRDLSCEAVGVLWTELRESGDGATLSAMHGEGSEEALLEALNELVSTMVPSLPGLATRLLRSDIAIFAKSVGVVASVDAALDTLNDGQLMSLVAWVKDPKEAWTLDMGPTGGRLHVEDELADLITVLETMHVAGDL